MIRLNLFVISSSYSVKEIFWSGKTIEIFNVFVFSIDFLKFFLLRACSQYFQIKHLQWQWIKKIWLPENNIIALGILEATFNWKNLVASCGSVKINVSREILIRDYFDMNHSACTHFSLRKIIQRLHLFEKKSNQRSHWRRAV